MSYFAEKIWLTMRSPRLFNAWKSLLLGDRWVLKNLNFHSTLKLLREQVFGRVLYNCTRVRLAVIFKGIRHLLRMLLERSRESKYGKDDISATIAFLRLRPRAFSELSQDGFWKSQLKVILHFACHKRCLFP